MGKNCRYTFFAGGAVLLALAGCSHLSQPGGSVMVYSGDSITLIQHCKRLGIVQGTSGWSIGGAITEMRNKAAEIGADSVAIVNEGGGLTPFYANGIAFYCGKQPSQKRQGGG